MNLRAWTLLSLLLFPTLAACAEKKDLSPPPLNPHPKEALHVTVTFDHPEDAKRYRVTMKALYQNQQRECGYFDPLRGGGSFVYPYGTFDIPNESRDPRQARFDVYLDRYNEDSCNWELAAPDFTVHDTHTGRDAFGHWGLDEDLVPGTEYKAVCQFKATEFPQNCYGRRPVPDRLHYSRVPITVHVSANSAPLRPRTKGFFSPANFVKPVTSDSAPSSPSPGDQ
ncbi:hypothetical protein QFZ41_001477 [Luteibacter sp. W1I16]|uniref:hypothetical protein n=1 Tax=Luteibacter sp. W1I16 TaxID=3373922 RepID=UPI003D1E16D0